MLNIVLLSIILQNTELIYIDVPIYKQYSIEINNNEMVSFLNNDIYIYGYLLLMSFVYTKKDLIKNYILVEIAIAECFYIHNILKFVFEKRFMKYRTIGLSIPLIFISYN